MEISKIMFTTIIIMSLSIAVSAQDQNKQEGLYLTNNDFVKHQVLPPAGDKAKMRTHEFLGSNYVSISRQGGYRKTYLKNDIFGYRKDEKDYRFFKSKTYQILDTVGFIIYRSNILIQRGKGYTPAAAYFFSLTTGTDLLPLTRDNLKRSFNNMPDFYYAVDAYLKSDRELINFDNSLKQYKLKYLYFKNSKATSPVQAAQ